jgi:hypothetical protein
MRTTPVGHLAALLAIMGGIAAAACTDSTGPNPPSGEIALTAEQVSALDSAVTAAVDSNPSDPNLVALRDSALGVLAAGVKAKQLDVSTDLTTAPLYFVGIHRAYTITGGSAFSTWTVVGFDDPSHVSILIDLGGFAQGGATPPDSASGPIGGAGVGNARFFQLGAGGTLTSWIVSSGTESFVSDSMPGTACPGFTPIPNVTCTVETMHVHFDVSAAGGTNGAGARHATVSTDVDVPTMRLNYRL